MAGESLPLRHFHGRFSLKLVLAPGQAPIYKAADDVAGLQTFPEVRPG